MRRSSILTDEGISILSDGQYDSTASSLATDSSAICYASDDSGLSISTNSEHMAVGKHKRKPNGKHKVICDNGKALRKPGETIAILIAVKENINNKVSANDDELLDIILSLAEYMPGQYTSNLQWYIEDVERNILQMNSLARNLADKEIKIYKKGNMKVPELRKEMEVISDQLGDAKNKSKHLRDKLGIILDDIEKYLGDETREDSHIIHVLLVLK